MKVVDGKYFKLKWSLKRGVWQGSISRENRVKLHVSPCNVELL